MEKNFFGSLADSKTPETKTISTIDFLKYRTNLAVESKAPALLYEVRGMIVMAKNLKAITTIEFSTLMNMLGEYGEGQAE